MQLSEWEEEIRNRLSEDSADFWRDTQIRRAINKGIAYFCHEELWPWLQTVRTGDSLTVGNNTLDLPVDLDIVRAFNVFMQRGTDAPYLAKRLSPFEGLMLSTRHTSNSMPRWFYLNSTSTAAGVMTYQTRFVPTADDTYNITFHYLRRPAVLANPTDEPDIPEDYQDGVLAYVTATLWLPELQNSGPKAQEQMELYNAMLDNARMDMNRHAPDEHVIVGGVADEGLGMGIPVLPPGYGEHYGWGDF